MGPEWHHFDPKALRVVNRIQIEKVLEGAKIKLGSVRPTWLRPPAGPCSKRSPPTLKILQALASMAKGKLREKRATLEEALRGRLGPYQGMMLDSQLWHRDVLDQESHRIDDKSNANAPPLGGHRRLTPFRAWVAARTGNAYVSASCHRPAARHGAKRSARSRLPPIYPTHRACSGGKVTLQTAALPVRRLSARSWSENLGHRLQSVGGA